MPGINAYEFLILVVLALVILGPERLPQYAQNLARWVRQARGMAENAKDKFREETGTDFDSVDWKRYDPRQYDPRRIIREALTDEYASDFQEARTAVTSTLDSARQATDPRELFRGPSRPAGVPPSGLSARSGGAVAAGMAGSGPRADPQGSAAMSRATPAHEAPTLHAAPFDGEAT